MHSRSSKHSHSMTILRKYSSSIKIPAFKTRTYKSSLCSCRTNQMKTNDFMMHFFLHFNVTQRTLNSKKHKKMEYLYYFSCDSINITYYSQRGCKKKMTAIPTSLLKQTRIYATQWRNSSSDAEFQRKKQQNSKNLNEWYKTAHPCNVQRAQNTSPRAFSCSILNHVLLMISLQLFLQHQCLAHSSSSHVIKTTTQFHGFFVK